MTGPLNFNFDNIFASTLQPIDPGIDPPLPIRCSPQALSFVDNIDKVFITTPFPYSFIIQQLKLNLKIETHIILMLGKN